MPKHTLFPWAIFIASTVILTSTAAADLTNGSAAFYAFNGSGADSSGQGNDAVVTGCSVDGWLSQPKGTNAYVELPRELFNGVSNFTFSAFGRLSDTATQYRHILSCAGTNSANELLLDFDAVNGKWYFYRGGTGYLGAVDDAMSDLQWHHVALSASNGTHRLWIDGELAGSAAGPSAPLSVSEGGAFLGQDQDVIGGGFDAAQAWHGGLDNVRIYHRALSAAEIAELSAETFNGNTYYVDASSGSDSNDGLSWSAAKQTLQAAVDSAVDGDWVMVTNGTYNSGSAPTPGYDWENRVCITNSITVKSVNGPGVTIIDGGGEMRGVYLCSSAVFSGFTITNGLASITASEWYADSGGGICFGGDGSVSNCVISGNSGYDGGGVSGFKGGQLIDCTLSGNTASYSGGGSYYGTLIDCVFSGNSAKYGGGSFFSTLSGCTLTGNTGSTYGGGSYDGTLTDCTLTDNWTTSSGGGGGGSYDGTLTGCTLAGNSSGNKGGGSFYGILTDCTLTGNSASSSGGGSYSGTLTDCTLAGNSASSSGGGSYYGTLTDCSLTGNSASSYGGGSYYGTLTDCTLTGNSSGYSGGGSYYGTLTGCMLSGNSAKYGGGSYSGTLTGCILSDNTALSGGGGSYGGTLTGCTLAGNSTSSSDGGGGGSYYGTLTDCTLAGNTAFNGGGNFDGTLTGCTLSGNSAYYGGGSYGGTLTGCILSSNTASVDGGGSYYAVLSHCTLSGNAAGEYGGGCNRGTLTGCIVYFNTAGSYGDNCYFPTMSYCCTTPLPDGTGNTSGDPCFADAANGDYSLLYGSPCIDAGTNSVLETDFDGSPRCVDGDFDGTAVTDIGAYEYQPDDTDSDGDGILDSDEVNTYQTDPALADTDGDGISDGAETDNGLDPLVSNVGADSDGDGILDADEVDYGLDPLESNEGADSDGDGISDTDEVDHGLDPLVSNEGLDTDGDGLSDAAEVNTHGTDPTLADTDGDGILDSDEVNTYQTDPALADTDGDGISDGAEVNSGLDPLESNEGADSDGDGILDADEVDSNLDPLVSNEGLDTDGDGLSDAAEVNTHGTDPTLADTDGDGMSDGAETDNGLDPLVSNVGVDSDGDGILDADEVDSGLDPLVSNEGLDTDGDGLSDADEVNTHGTDPTLADTDGDGISDSDELASCTNPLVSNEGLAAFYPFNGNGNDSSGQGNDASVTGCTVDGWLSQPASTAAYAELPSTLYDGRSNFTFSAFGRLADTDTRYRNLLSCAGTNSANELLLYYDTSVTRWQLYWGGTKYVLTTNAVMSDLAWHHVAFSASNGTYRLWLDGGLVETAAGSAEALTVSDGGVFLGQDQDAVGGGFDADQTWHGDVDDVRVYHRVLSAAEIAALSEETHLSYPVTFSTSGSGAVAAEPYWSAAASGTVYVPSNTALSVEAVPDDGWLFMEWGGDLSGGYTASSTTLWVSSSNSITALFSDDADGDGLANTNETALGTDPRNADSDGDAFSDYEEYIAATSMTNAADFFCVDIDGSAVCFNSASNRRYTLLVCTNLAEGVWSAVTNLAGTGTEVFLSDPDGGKPHACYRVQVELGE